MKKIRIVFIITMIIIISAVSGFSGALLANRLIESRMNSANYISEESSINQPDNFSYINFTNDKQDSKTIPEIAYSNKDSIVEISTEIVQWGSVVGQYVTQGAGSGVIITTEGHIITNEHVIDNASKITVRLTDGTEYIASIIGSDTVSDIAVLKIEAENIKVATFGDSSNLFVGDLAVVIGNPLGKLGGTVTEGIISALDREIEVEGQKMTLLQTSAAINPGNSGGGIFNKYGELIGIVNAKTSGSGIEGLGFAIPINSVLDVIDDIIEFGYVIGRIDIGFTMIDILDRRIAWLYNLNDTGVYVLQVHTDIKLLPGDRIDKVNGEKVFTSENINQIVKDLVVGDIVLFEIERNGEIIELEVSMMQRKPNKGA